MMFRITLAILPALAVAMSSNPTAATPLQDLGGSGCTPTSKCSECQGDCDNNADCADGLVCFQRDKSTQLVVGCGQGGDGDNDNEDYCVKPDGKTLINLGDSGCTASSKCAECQGDCDSNADCADGLVCFQRDRADQIVLGCQEGGGGYAGSTDFCVKPDNKTLINLGNSGCTTTKKCGPCQGDCDKNADCADGLTCFQRSRSDQHVPGCDPGGGGDIGSTDYCFKHDGKSLLDLGGSGCTGSSTCTECQGDCDRDSDCAEGLACFQRDKSDELVPGCERGGPGDNDNEDYCFKPEGKLLENLGDSGCNANSKCGQCQGDCDYDSDCAEGLTCFQRDKRTQIVPGCVRGGDGDMGSTDYCFRVPTPVPTPAPPTPSPTTAAMFLGSDKCTTGQVCTDGSWAFYYANIDKEECMVKCAAGAHGYPDSNIGNCTHFTFDEAGKCLLYTECNRGEGQVSVVDEVFEHTAGFTTCDVPPVPPKVDEWVLIAAQDVRAQLFNHASRNTLLMNENDPDATAFMNIGLLSKDQWLTKESNYHIKLVYFNDNEDEDGANVLMWRQTNWFREETILGKEKEQPDNLYAHKGCATFEGLGKSRDGCAVLDGNGKGGCWWNCVGALCQHGGGIPAWFSVIKKQYKLYLWGNPRNVPR